MNFPFVTCKRHPGIFSLGYIICVHIINNSQVYHKIPASSDSLGEVLCKSCVGKELKPCKLKLICAKCLEEIEYVQ